MVGDAGCRSFAFMGPLSFPVDAHVALTVAKLREFRPDLVPITGPGDESILGFWASNLVGCRWWLRGIRTCTSMLN